MIYLEVPSQHLLPYPFPTAPPWTSNTHNRVEPTTTSSQLRTTTTYSLTWDWTSSSRSLAVCTSSWWPCRPTLMRQSNGSSAILQIKCSSHRSLQTPCRRWSITRQVHRLLINQFAGTSLRLRHWEDWELIGVTRQSISMASGTPIRHKLLMVARYQLTQDPARWYDWSLERQETMRSLQRCKWPTMCLTEAEKAGDP